MGTETHSTDFKNHAADKGATPTHLNQFRPTVPMEEAEIQTPVSHWSSRAVGSTDI